MGGDKMRLDCRDCGFSKTVSISDEKKPAEHVVEHGKATGHRVEMTRVEEAEE